MKFFAVVMIYLLLPCLAQAATTLSLQGRILKADGTPLLAPSVQFKIQVRSPGVENCLLYQEIQTLDMTASGGVFAVNIGSATATRPGAGVDGNFTLVEVFSNRGSFDLSGAPGACGVGTSFTPGSVSDHRKLYYEFNEGTGWEVVPAVAINWAPYAIEAQQVSGFKAANLLRAVDVSGNPASVSAFIPTEMAELLALINGTSTRYVQPSSTATFSNTITFSNAPQFSGTPSAGSDLTNKTYVDSAVAGALPNIGIAGTYYKVTTDAKGRVTSGASS